MPAPSFRPLPFLAGGHRQTILGYLSRSLLAWPYPTEELVVDAPGGIRLLVRASWQPDARPGAPAVVLVHGLGGCDRSTYMLATGDLAYRSGWHVLRVNLRGCGDALALCPRLFHAGVTEDLLAVLDWAASRVERLAVLGFSLGANLVLLTLSRHRAGVPAAVGAAAAVSPPLDLSYCADVLARPGNRFYQSYFLSNLKSSYRRRRRLLPEVYPEGIEARCRTIREFDDAITAPYSGFPNAAQYYAAASSGPLLSGLDLPTLLLAAGDDPLIPREAVERWAIAPAVEREITPSGGHVGFLGRSGAPGRFWAAERALSFFSRFLDGPGPAVAEGERG